MIFLVQTTSSAVWSTWMRVDQGGGRWSRQKLVPVNTAKLWSDPDRSRLLLGTVNRWA